MAAGGVNVIVVLVSGIALALVCSLFSGMPVLDTVSLLGAGIAGMSELIIITLLAAGMLGVVKAAGGIDYLLRAISRPGLGYRGAQAAMCLITAAVNLCTANNTVAILTTGSLSRDLARQHGIAPRRAASLLDTSSCIMQCLIPFGAQTLLATGMAGIAPDAPWRYLVYPWAQCVCVVVAVMVGRPRHAVDTSSMESVAD